MKTIICIPGLGGRANLFNKYKGSFPGFNIKTLDVIAWQEAQAKVDQMLADETEGVIFFCSCYGAQFALRAMEKYPVKTEALIVVEPFFMEFVWWRKIGYFLNNLVLLIIRGTHAIGLGRSKFKEVDYNMVEKQPLFFQPFYDISHQGSKDYFEKLKDIATFKLPPKVETKTLFIFSPRGFMRGLKKRARLQKIFINGDYIELGPNSHTIVTLAFQDITTAIKKWIGENLK
ncbi:MAG: hypothetical protein V4486_02670 [Patescibacteria group bacterium]